MSMPHSSLPPSLPSLLTVPMEWRLTPMQDVMLCQVYQRARNLQGCRGGRGVAAPLSAGTHAAPMAPAQRREHADGGSSARTPWCCGCRRLVRRGTLSAAPAQLLRPLLCTACVLPHPSAGWAAVWESRPGCAGRPALLPPSGCHCQTFFRGRGGGHTECLGRGGAHGG